MLRKALITIAIVAFALTFLWWAGERFDASPTVHPPDASLIRDTP